MKNAWGVSLLVIVTACGGGGGGDKDPDAGVAIDAAPDAAIDAPADAPPDASPTFALTRITPTSTSRVVDTTLTIEGIGITATPVIKLINCDQMTTTYDLTASAITATTITTSLAADPTRVQGLYTVKVTNAVLRVSV